MPLSLGPTDGLPLGHGSPLGEGLGEPEGPPLGDPDGCTLGEPEGPQSDGSSKPVAWASTIEPASRISAVTLALPRSLGRKDFIGYPH